MYRANSANLIRKIKMLIKKNMSMPEGVPYESDRDASRLAYELQVSMPWGIQDRKPDILTR